MLKIPLESPGPGPSLTLTQIDAPCPQCSVLGSLLFLTYINDIQYAVINAKFKLFADTQTSSRTESHSLNLKTLQIIL